MNFVIPDDYDQAYPGSPHVERLIPHGKVQALAFLAGRPVNVVNPDALT